MLQLELQFVTPHTQEELDKYFSEFAFLNNFLPTKFSEERLREILTPGDTLVYANKWLIGCFMLDINNKSVELHGICRPDIGENIQKPQLVKRVVYMLLFDKIFRDMDKDKIIIKADPDNKGVRGFAIQLGFTRVKNTDKGRLIWKLTKKDYEDRVRVKGMENYIRDFVDEG